MSHGNNIIKILEKIFAKNICQFLEMHLKMRMKQHGFQSGRSCLSQLLALEKSNNVHVIYWDFAKAFARGQWIDYIYICIIKRWQQCNQSPTILASRLQPYNTSLLKKRWGSEKSSRQKGSMLHKPIKSIGLALKTHHSHTIKFRVSMIILQRRIKVLQYCKFLQRRFK